MCYFLAKIKVAFSSDIFQSFFLSLGAKLPAETVKEYQGLILLCLCQFAFDFFCLIMVITFLNESMFFKSKTAVK